jgi:UDP-glucose 4-epimerase
MRVLVTGADGFIGSHLVEALLAAGHDVTGLILFNSFDSEGWLEGIDCHKIVGDIRDASLIWNLDDYEAVYHLAALGDVPYSGRAPKAYIDTNITGTMNVIEYCSTVSAQLLFMSSSEVYGGATKPLTEHDPFLTRSYYAASKVAGEKLVEASHYWSGVDARIVRTFNTYGPRQSVRAVIPSIITQALPMYSKVIKHGELTSSRDFLYVEDTARALIRAMTCSWGVYNIASGEDVTVSTLLYKIQERLRAKTMEQDPARMRPTQGEVGRLIGNAHLFTTCTGWKPEVDLNEGLDRTIAWWMDQ